jgi:hypothetical protein
VEDFDSGLRKPKKKTPKKHQNNTSKTEEKHKGPQHTTPSQPTTINVAQHTPAKVFVQRPVREGSE